MKTKVAFFDVDETLLNCKSMFSFLKFYIQNKHPNNFELIYRNYYEKINEKITIGMTREELNVFFYSLWKGFNQNEVKELSLQWYLQNKNSMNFFIKHSMNFLEDKKKYGYSIAAVSGSTYDILHGFINEYQFDKYFFTELEVKNGLYTGMLLSNPMIGKYKAQAISSFMIKEKINPGDCIAVGDHESDIPMLKSVGSGYLVKNNEFFQLVNM